MACIHPRRIKNKKGDYINVPCGHCAGCANQKALTYTTLSQLENKGCRYMFFVTLTYADEYLPTVKVYKSCVSDHGIDQLDFVLQQRSIKQKNGKQRIINLETHLETVYSDDVYGGRQYLEDMLKPLSDNKVTLHDDQFSVLYKPDLINFIKRVRFYVSRHYHITTNSVRYFAAGEYGPRRLRAHYHLLFYISDEKVALGFSDVVRQCWRYGISDCQLSANGKSIGYVSRYVTSNQFVFPLHKFSWSKVFSLHSQHYGEFPYAEHTQKLENLNYDTIGRRSFTMSGKIREVSTPVSLQNSLFPRCYKYVEGDDYCNVVRYQLYDRAIRKYGMLTVEQLTAKVLLDDDLRIYFPDSANPESTIRTALYTSKKVSRLAKLFSVSIGYYYEHVIKRFYQDKDSDNLRRFYQQMSTEKNSGQIYAIHLVDYYSNFPAQSWRWYLSNLSPENMEYYNRLQRFSDTIGVRFDKLMDQVANYTDDPLLQRKADLHNRIFRDGIKHKKLNDLNKVLYGKHYDTEICRK